MSCICSHLPTITLNRWFDKWAEYASFRRGTNGEPATVCSPLKIQHIAPRPGAIDNSPLLDAQGSNLREGLSEGQDFTVINKETWELLHKWCAAGGMMCDAARVVSWSYILLERIGCHATCCMRRPSAVFVLQLRCIYVQVHWWTRNRAGMCCGG